MSNNCPHPGQVLKSFALAADGALSLSAKVEDGRLHVWVQSHHVVLAGQYLEAANDPK